MFMSRPSIHPIPTQHHHTHTTKSKYSRGQRAKVRRERERDQTFGSTDFSDVLHQLKRQKKTTLSFTLCSKSTELSHASQSWWTRIKRNSSTWWEIHLLTFFLSVRWEDEIAVSPTTSWLQVCTYTDVKPIPIWTSQSLKESNGVYLPKFWNKKTTTHVCNSYKPTDWPYTKERGFDLGGRVVWTSWNHLRSSLNYIYNFI